MEVPEVDAILFDVFGTVVDWHGGIIRDGQNLGAEKGLDLDWGAFANAWREEYHPSMDRVRQGEIPWVNLDALHRDSLERVLEHFGLDGLIEEEKDWLNRVWHRLDPWPDSVPGLLRLRNRYMVAPLSNGHMRLLANMAKRAEIPWDLVLSAELSRHYKPDPETYLTCAQYLDLPPDRVMMVAAHEYDLKGAREAGLHTAFIHRPLEWGLRQADSIRKPDGSEYGVVAENIQDLTETLGT